MNSEDKKVIAESEIGSDSVGHSNATSELEGASKASSKDLELALVASNDTIHAMDAELKRLKAENAALKAKGEAPKTSDDSINKLAEMLAGAIAGAKTTGPKETDNINRTQGFTERQTIDGNSLMEAQSKMIAFKEEEKLPISIAKSFQSQFGPFLAITVNGVRVAIPCDGKTYYINKTHAIHARERLAKVDRLVSNQEPDIKEINA